MINSLDLANFKCFEKLQLPLNQLTLLSGVNASGKSSILQSLALLQQTMQESELRNRIILNGVSVKLGTVADVVDQVKGKNSFEVGLRNDEVSCRWLFSGNRNDMSLEVTRAEVNDEVIDYPNEMFLLLPLDLQSDVSLSLVRNIENLTYISAGREGPRETHLLEDMYEGRPNTSTQVKSSNERETQARTAPPKVGAQGGNTVGVLYQGRDELVASELVVTGVPPTLLHQVGARMDRFFPGFAAEATKVPRTNVATLGIRVSEATDYHRPIHCGFGITQVLPIVVAALSIPKNSLLLIENPGVHLHPAGQALMGQFLAELTSAGIQVIIETHSDHVLNGIRRAVKKNDLSADSVVIHFFRARSRDGEPQVLSPILDQGGNIDVWPNGFFDQFDKDIDYFAGWGE